jgi:hypothetical protein
MRLSVKKQYSSPRAFRIALTNCGLAFDLAEDVPTGEQRRWLAMIALPYTALF